MTQPAITVENLSKSYRIGLREESRRTFKETLAGLVKAPIERLRRLREHGAEGEDVFWALKDVSFDVQPGQIVGIIGRNGAGKSTLLKVLSKIVEPTEGKAIIRGRVGSLLEVGTGFHPELTGRENIYLNGAILGMTKAEIAHKFDEIVEFSGVDKFLDTAVKHYSSGMRVRLGFAVAAHLEPEILIVDEVLAVGDVEFQKKCLGKMKDVAGHGRTVIFVSHNMAAIQSQCSRIVVINKGTVIFDGELREGVQCYLALSRSSERVLRVADRQDREGSGEVRFTDVQVRGSESGASDVMMGEGFEIRLRFTASSPVDNPNFSINVADATGLIVCRAATRDSHGSLPRLSGPGEIICRVRRPNLLPGTYWVHVAASLSQSRERLDHVRDAASFTISPADVYGTGRVPDEGVCYVDCLWELKTHDLPVSVHSQ